MFGNFFNFQSKNKDGKSVKDESSKKNKNKKGKGKETTATTTPEEENVAKITSSADIIKNVVDDDEHFEDVQTTTNVDNDLDNDASIPSALPELRSDVPSVPELLLQLEQVENEARRLADGLEQMTAEKAALEREMNALQTDNDRLRANTEALVAEKWELSAANADLQNRLQTMAITYMQGAPDTMLQEELRKLQMALSEERKVTEKLSRNLELEKRRSESLEQKAKSANRRSGASVSGAASVLPEDVRLRDDVLSNSMEKFRIHCERLSSSLDECEKKLTGFEIQEDYHAADLRKELQAVRRLLNEDRRRSSGESQKLFDAQTLFGQVYKDYNNLVESMKHQAEKAIDKRRNHHDAKDDIDETTLKLRRAIDDVEMERQKVETLNEKLRRCEADLESIPLLRAQIDVYRSDFNAEREARQKIAGEKADLVDELHRLRRHDNVDANVVNDREEARRNNAANVNTPRDQYYNTYLALTDGTVN